MIHRFAIVGFLNPLGADCGFLIPVIETAGLLLIQETDRNDEVLHLRPLPDDWREFLIPSNNQKTRLVFGGKAFHAFKFSNNDICVGRRWALRRILKKRLGDLSDHMYIRFDVAKFIGDRQMARDIAAEIGAVMALSDEVLAKNWLNIELDILESEVMASEREHFAARLRRVADLFMIAPKKLSRIRFNRLLKFLHIWRSTYLVPSLKGWMVAAGASFVVFGTLAAIPEPSYFLVSPLANLLVAPIGGLVANVMVEAAGGKTDKQLAILSSLCFLMGATFGAVSFLIISGSLISIIEDGDLTFPSVLDEAKLTSMWLVVAALLIPFVLFLVLLIEIIFDPAQGIPRILGISLGGFYAYRQAR